jgi:hypothetical protein
MRPAIAMLFVACSSPPVQTLRPQAASDLRCPEEQVTIVDLGAEGTYVMGAMGCGRKATYVLKGKTWHPNTPVTDVPK